MKSLKENALETYSRIFLLASALKNKKREWWKQPLVFFVVAIGIVVFLTAARPAYAEVEIQGYLYKFIAWLLEIIAGFLGSLILSVIDLLIVVSGYNNFIDADVVNTGWVLVRDVANMFYIFVMLVIAFGTMLKLEAYTWTKLLPRLIITAVVVNFSRTIMGVIIDFAQVIMITFVNGYAAAAGGNFAQGFNLDAMFKIKQGAIAVGTNTDFKIILAYLLATVMLAIALVVVSVFLAILLGRIITIWILVILSPIAFLMGTFPKGQEYYSKWWKQFQNAVIVGPVLAFFLWLSLATMSGGNSWSAISGGSALGGRELDTNDLQIGGGQAGGIEKVGSFVVSIAMLMIGLQMTQELGVMGSGLASGAASAIKSTASKVARAVAVPAVGVVATGGVGALGAWTLGGAGALGGTSIAPGGGGLMGLARKGAEKGIGYVGKSVATKLGTKVMESSLGGIPAYFTEGARRREEELKRSMTDAQARERTRFEFKRDGFAPDYMRLAKQQRASARAKDFGTQFEDNELAASTTGKAWLRKFKEGDLGHEGNDIHRGLTQSIFQASYIDDMFDIDTPEMKELRDALLHDVVRKNADGTVNEEETEKARRAKTSDNYRKLMIRGVVGDTKDVDDVLWLSADELASKSTEEKRNIEARLGAWSNKHQDELGLLADQKEIAKKNGHYENMGLASYSDSTKGYKVNLITEQASLISGSLRKAKLTDKAAVNPHSFMTMLGDANNKAAGLNELGKLILPAWLSGMDETNFSRNFPGRTTHVMWGNAPGEQRAKKADDSGGWIDVDENYARAHAADMQEILSSPLMLTGMFAKETELNVGVVRGKMGNYKVIVGNDMATLEDISKNDGDILKSLKPMDKETREQVEYERSAIDYGKNRSGKEAPVRPARTVNAEAAQNAVARQIEALTKAPIDSIDSSLQPVVEEFSNAVSGLSVTDLKKALGDVVSVFRGLKPKAEVEAALSARSYETDASGSLTPQARIAQLLYTLVKQDDKKMIDILTNIQKGGVSFGGADAGKDKK